MSNGYVLYFKWLDYFTLYFQYTHTYVETQDLMHHTPQELCYWDLQDQGKVSKQLSWPINITLLMVCIRQVELEQQY